MSFKIVELGVGRAFDWGENQPDPLDLVRNKLSKGYNVIIGIVGVPRSGKSWTALRICEELSPRFTIDNIVYDSQGLLRLLNSGKLQRGDCVLWDESGVGLYSLDYYERENKNALKVLQTFGFMGLVVVMTLPSFSFIDSHARKMFNYLLETKAKNEKSRTVCVKWANLSYDKRTGKDYRRYVTILRSNSPNVRKYWNFKAPSDKLANAYIDLSETWKKQLISKFEKEFSKNEKLDEDSAADKILTNLREFARFDEYGKPQIRRAAIEAAFGVGNVISRRIAVRVQRKYDEQLARGLIDPINYVRGKDSEPPTTRDEVE